MVKYGDRDLDATFAALANPTRRAILARLALGEASVGVLAKPFAISPPAVSKHLTVPEGAGLVTRHERGRVRRCRLEPVPMRRAAGRISHYRRFWEDRPEALARHLDGTPGAAGHAKGEGGDGTSEGRR